VCGGKGRRCFVCPLFLKKKKEENNKQTQLN